MESKIFFHDFPAASQTKVREKTLTDKVEKEREDQGKTYIYPVNALTLSEDLIYTR